MVTRDFFSFLLSSLILLLLLSFFAPLVSAVGFQNLPAEREFIFVPNSVIDIPFNVINGNFIDVVAYGDTPGNIASLGTAEDDNIMEYAKIEDSAPKTGPRTVNLHIALPSMMKPGVYYIYVGAMDYPEGSGQGTVSAIAQARIRITIRVLSQEKFIEILSVRTPAVAEGLDSNTTISVISRTMQNIDVIFADVRVYKDDQLLSTQRTGLTSLNTAETTTLFTIVSSADLIGGEYHVNGTVYYDGKTAELPADILKIGTLHVDVPEHTPQIVFNTTNKFLFNISNQWNRELQEVFATVAIPGQSKKTASQNIPPFGKTSFELYFDRDESLLAQGTTANITVTFKDYDPEMKKYVAKTELFVKPLQVVSPPPVLEKKKLDIQVVLLIAMGIIIIIMILLLIWVLFSRKKKTESPQQTPVASAGQTFAPASVAAQSSEGGVTPQNSSPIPNKQPVPQPQQTPVKKQ